MTRVLIAGGGTGGHVFPMIAVADALRANEPGVDIVFVGTGRGIENRVVPDWGGRLELLDVLPLRGGGPHGFIRGAWRALTVLPRAVALVKRLRPDVVFSVGGYAAGPVTLAARSCGVPVTLLEPNAVWGFTNKLLKPLVQRVYGGFPEITAGLGDHAIWTGVPLRKRFEASDYNGDAAMVRVLVMGGSQGALALNETVPRALARYVGTARLSIVHQTGRDKDPAVRTLYAELGLSAEVVPFIDDVARAIADADVVIERAGASSVAELCSVGRPALLVPYPFAADDHQRHNAESLARHGAALCVPQPKATVDRIASELAELFSNLELRRAMAERSRARGRPEAASTIARDLLALASSGRQLMGSKNALGAGANAVVRAELREKEAGASGSQDRAEVQRDELRVAFGVTHREVPLP